MRIRTWCIFFPTYIPFPHLLLELHASGGPFLFDMHVIPGGSLKYQSRDPLYALIFRTDLFTSRFCFSTEINSDFLRRICKGAADADDTGVALGPNFKGVRSNRGIHYKETQASCFGRRESSSTSGYNPLYRYLFFLLPRLDLLLSPHPQENH